MKVSKALPVTTMTVREKLRQAAQDSGMTQEEIGLRMGFAKDSARKAVSRLLNAEVDYDPRLSTLLAFASAINRPLKELL
jgi:transcriptional regulator with XRE-family HTH domain